MRKLKEMKRKARLTGLLLSGLGLMAVSPAFGGDASCAPACTPAQPKACCTKVYEEAGDKLAVELDRLTAECCAPKTCAPTCTNPDTCCGEESSDDGDCCSGRLTRLFDDCDGCGNFLEDNGWKLSGWLEFGITFNGNRPQNNLNTPGVGFNQADSQFMLNQLYFVLEKDAAANEDCFGWVVALTCLLVLMLQILLSSVGLTTHQTLTEHGQETILPLLTKSVWQCHSCTLRYMLPLVTV